MEEHRFVLSVLFYFSGESDYNKFVYSWENTVEMEEIIKDRTVISTREKTGLYNRKLDPLYKWRA